MRNFLLFKLNVTLCSINSVLYLLSLSVHVLFCSQHDINAFKIRYTVLSL